MSASVSGLRIINVTFDDANLVSNAGPLIISTLPESPGLKKLIEAKVSLSGRVEGADPERKVLTLVHAMTAGASHIDHADMLRSGSTEVVLGHKVMAPSAIGTFLRSFSFGHLRQLDPVSHSALQRARQRGAGPMRICMSSTSTPPFAKCVAPKNLGANFSYTKCRSCHAILAVRADTGVTLN